MRSPESSDMRFMFEAIVATLRKAALKTIAHEIRGQCDTSQKDFPTEIVALLRKLDGSSGNYPN